MAPEGTVPRVSTIIPTAGRPHLVREAVTSALAQTMRDLEVVVVVDGPDPATEAVLAGIGDPRLRWIVNESRQGAARARDKGVAAARAEWIAFLDDDDTWAPGKLAAQLAAAPPGPALISTLSIVGTADDRSVKPVQPYEGSVPVDEWLFDRRSWLASGGFIQCSSLLVPRAICERLRFAAMRHHDDWEFVIRAVKQEGCRLVTVPEALVTHLFDPARASLQSTLTWKASLDWARHMRGLLTPRAQSGFLLITAARSAANAGLRGAMLPLLAAAFRLGRPTPKQLFGFALLWLMPASARRAARRTTAEGAPVLPQGSANPGSVKPGSVRP